ncbi:MAG: Ig-like domain repeat protein [Acidobacteria bacterium]|nr:Ig-like domain repeat protein [Acidobacteriota bacterium]
MAWSERGAAPNGDARIVLATSADGRTWSIPAPIDPSPTGSGHQIMSSLVFAQGKVTAVYYDFRDDVLASFGPFPVLADPIQAEPPPPLRHTVDVRAVQADPGDRPIFTRLDLPSTKVSRYPSILLVGPDSSARWIPLQYNPPNLPLFSQGTKPFIGLMDVEQHDPVLLSRIVTQWPPLFDPQNPALMNPALLNPALLNPALLNPALLNPALLNATLTDITWTVKNSGNTASAYAFAPISASGLPEDVETQLLIYRIYKTPAAENCRLNQDAVTLEFLAIILNPALLNPALLNTTFAAAPGEEIYVTLRLLDRNAGSSTASSSKGYSKWDIRAAVSGTDLNLTNLGVVASGQAANTGETEPRATLLITTITLPDGVFGFGYDQTLKALGGRFTRHWSLVAGILPPGLSLDDLGRITGIPTRVGLFRFTVKVTDGEQTDFRELTLIINKAPTQTGVLSNPRPSVWGQPVQVTAPVTTQTSGVPGPTGSVQFFDYGDLSLGTAVLTAGQASITRSDLSVATHALTATFSGDGNYYGSTSGTLFHKVDKASTATALVSTPNPSVWGQGVELKATVSVQPPGAGTPTGLVEFFDGAVSLGTAAVSASGQALITRSNLAVATHTLRAVYSGDGNFNGSRVRPLSRRQLTKLRLRRTWFPVPIHR